MSVFKRLITILLAVCAVFSLTATANAVLPQTTYASVRDALAAEYEEGMDSLTVVFRTPQVIPNTDEAWEKWKNECLVDPVFEFSAECKRNGFSWLTYDAVSGKNRLIYEIILCFDSAVMESREDDAPAYHEYPSLEQALAAYVPGTLVYRISFSEPYVLAGMVKDAAGGWTPESEAAYKTFADQTLWQPLKNAGLYDAYVTGYYYSDYNETDQTLTITARELYFNAYSDELYRAALAETYAALEADSGKYNIDAPGKTRYEILDAINDYLCETVRYNEVVQESGNDKISAIMQTAYSALVAKETVCAGYAEALRVICEHYGIPCLYIGGLSYEGEECNLHAWNYVQMDDGNWYAVDTTWNDAGKISSDHYFLVGSSTYVGSGCTFSQDHAPSYAAGAALPALNATHYVPGTPAPAPQIRALSTDIAFVADGVRVDIDAYNINNYNYFKLRDLAALVNGTAKSFSVEWDAARSTIILTAGAPYAPLATDLQPGDGTHKIALQSAATLILNGEEITLEAYNIDGFNYFKLRDLCEAFDIGVTWDNATRTTGIDTSTGYIAEN